MGARWFRLKGELPGQVKGIDYAHLAMAACGGSPEAAQDVALEKLDEFHHLTLILQRARVVVGWDRFRVWLMVRAIGKPVNFTANAEGVHRNSITRTLKVVDMAVRDELVERDAIEGYGGRDLLDAGSDYTRGVQVYRAPSKEDE